MRRDSNRRVAGPITGQKAKWISRAWGGADLAEGDSRSETYKLVRLQFQTVYQLGKAAGLQMEATV